MGIDAQMFVKLTDQRLSESEVKHLAFTLGEAYGPHKFWIFKPNESYNREFRHCLTIINEYHQDGDTIYPAANEQFIEVHLGTRYYGEGYERGDLPFILSVAEWLERRLRGCQVFYGGDSSGVSAIAFDAVERAKIFAHFADNGHRPYHGYFERGLGNGGKEMCPYCEEPMTQYGFGGVGGVFKSFTCDGCGEKKETHDGGATWELNKKEAR